MQSLINLVLYENQLSEELPPSIGECKKLKTLYLQHNCFSGNIPGEQSPLTNPPSPTPSHQSPLTNPSHQPPLTNPLSPIPLTNPLSPIPLTNPLSPLSPDELGDCKLLKLLYLDHNVFEGDFPVKMVCFLSFATRQACCDEVSLTSTQRRGCAGRVWRVCWEGVEGGRAFFRFATTKPRSDFLFLFLFLFFFSFLF
jgi:hypothetical protein